MPSACSRIPGLLALLALPSCGGGTSTSETLTNSESTTAVDSDEPEPTGTASTGAEPIAPGDLLFRREQDPDASLWSFHRDDGVSTPFAGFALDWAGAATFSPDGARIAVAFVRADTSRAIDILESDQTQRSLLADGAALGFVVGIDGLAWSPDGATIAASGSQAGGGLLALLDVGSGASELLVEFPGGLVRGAPVWSPDGSLLAVEVHDGAQSDIMIHELASGETRLIDATPAQEVEPVFSPDGTQLAFGSDRDGACTLLLHDLSTATSTAVAPTWAGPCAPQPDWTAIGDRIAYAHNETRELRVFTVGLDDHQSIAASDFPGGPTRIRWSPDGDTIAYQVAADPRPAIRVVSASGEPLHNIGEGDGVIWRPAPSPP